jgi:hypothetical protein
MQNVFSMLALVSLTSAVWAATPAAVVPGGTDVLVRVNETIDSKIADEGRVYSAHLDQDLLDSQGNVAVPKRSKAELLVRQVDPGKDLVLDLQAVFIGGRRHFVASDAYDQTNKKPGVGKNWRTARMTGGGAIIGSILGALGGGGEGAAIGAASGGAAGGLFQIFTRGKAVKVPNEAVLTFRLEKALRLYEVE